MKKFIVISVCVLFALMPTGVVRGDLLSQYGVNISDANSYGDNINLYQLFNRYFAEQLGEAGLYASSNDLFNDRGVNPYTDWTTSGSQLVGAFKVAALGHEMSMLDASGNIVASLISVGGTVNIGQADGITDLSGQSVVNIADGLNVSFRLDAYWGDSHLYGWSSNPDENDGRLNPYSNDNMIHMIALDITDLYNAKHGTLNDSVYMFGWEDLHLTAYGGGLPADWDYQDFVAIMTNLTPNDNAVVPEPGTMLIVGMGVLALPLARRRLRKK